jgi:hypothetical protein
MDTSNDILNKINDVFKLPIDYNACKKELKSNIVTDLELINTIDASYNTIYSFCFNTNNDVSKKITEQISKYYTTDVKFLKDNQSFLKEYKREERQKYTDYSPNYKNIIDIILL